MKNSIVIVIMTCSFALFGCESDRSADKAPVQQPVGVKGTPLPQAIKSVRPTESVKIEEFVNEKLPPYFQFRVSKIEPLDDAGTIGVAGTMRALSDLRSTGTGRILAVGSELESQMILKSDDGGFALKGANFNPMEYQPL